MANKFMQDIKKNTTIGIAALIVGSLALVGVVALAIILL